jgi:hypothetical protein
VEISVIDLNIFITLIHNFSFRAPSSELLERQTRALEESLNKLKIAMHPDKTKSTYVSFF